MLTLVKLITQTLLGSLGYMYNDYKVIFDGKVMALGVHVYDNHNLWK